MKKSKPSKNQTVVFHQLCKLIPSNLVTSLAKKHGIVARSFTAWSHISALLYAHFAHCLSLNDVCDALRHHAGKLLPIRGATPPSRNNFSHANKTRNPEMIKELFWKVFEHLSHQHPGFAPSGKYSKFPKRFKRAIHAVDSTTIQLVHNCIDWAKHRRRKAAAKMHLRLNLQSFLPAFVIVEEASHHDDTRSVELCADLKDGEVVIFDKAYVNFCHLLHLTTRGVFWVLRAKDNMAYKVSKRLLKSPKGNILKDELVYLKNTQSKKDYPKVFRRVEAEVEIEGKTVVMVFITNNLEWAASSVCDLYKSRWAIEAFFKQLKQTLQLNNFLGHSKRAIEWQIWAALLVYLLLRFQAFMSGWHHGFSRLVTVIRALLWDRFALLDLLKSYGTAGGLPRLTLSPNPPYLKGINWDLYGTA